MANIVLTDDHILLRNGLASLVKKQGHQVLYEADNGQDLIEKIASYILPDIILLDINMPLMDGYETAKWIKSNHPEILILALTMYDDDHSIIKMLNSGAKGYILKDCDPAELAFAIESLLEKGYYYTELVNNKLLSALHKQDNKKNEIKILLTLNEKEKQFLTYCCTELTYKEIAEKMFISPRTVDNYRDGLFEKLQIKSRVGLVMFAIKNGFVNL